MCCSILLVLLCLKCQSIGDPHAGPRRILILYEVGTTHPGVGLIEEGLRDAFQSSHQKLEIYREYMESVLFPDPADQQRFREFYIRKYLDRRPDVIITVGPSPLKFMVETHKRAFPGVPIVFCLPVWVPSTLTLDSDFTGVLNDLAPGETIQAGLHLQPGTKHIVVAGGTSYIDSQIAGAVKEQLSPYESSFDVSYLTNLKKSELVDRLHHLPAHTIVLYTSLSRDAQGETFISGTEGTSTIAASANAPVFVLYETFLNHGEVGGKVSSNRRQGRIAGELALRILQGEKPQNIPQVHAGTVPMFDWRALKRWGMKESALPPGSIVLNRQPGFWELYQHYVLATLFVLLAQSAAILGLLWQRKRRRNTEFELKKSEEKFSKAFRQSPFAIAIARMRDDRYLEVNETFEVQTGYKRDEVIGRSPLELSLWADPHQRSAFLAKLSANGSVKDLEVRWRRKDGQIRATLGSAELIEVHGEPCVLSVIADITERKQAEEAMASFSRRLLEAQEAERTRIARELHDDINQRLALVAVTLKTTQQTLPNAAGKASSLLDEAGGRVCDLANDIQALSHRLHSSKLEYLGLEAAASGFCKELAKRQNVEIDFQCDALPEDLPREVSLCLFRVLQEALHNAVKYSGVNRFEVSLHGALREIQLRVHDPGAGFDAKMASNGNGLGLTSMRERLKLVSGELFIDSELGHGTTVLARIPLGDNKIAAGAAA